MERKHQEMLDMQNQMAEMQRQLEVRSDASSHHCCSGAYYQSVADHRLQMS